MRYLLDTHVILWCAQGNTCLPQRVRTLMSQDECCYSIASLWEIAIKEALGKLKLDFTLSDLDQSCLAAGFQRLPIGISHLELIKVLPDIHRDPFYRLLITQAQAEGLVIVTQDRFIPQYPVRTFW